MRFWARMALIGAMAGPPTLAAGEPPEIAARDLRASEILESLRAVTDARAAAGRNEALDLILSHRSYPGACATPLLLYLSQARSSLPEAARALLDEAGPELTPATREVISAIGDPATSVHLRFTADGEPTGGPRHDDGDLESVPDEIRRILTSLQEAHADVVETFERSGLPARPAPAVPERVLQVEIADLPADVAGWVWTGEGGPVLILDRDSVLGPRGDAVLRHQVAHLLQLTLSRDESPWWYEAHAIWAEDPSAAHAAQRAPAVQTYLEASRWGLDLDLVETWEGAFLWPHYLVASGAAADILGSAWEEMAALPGNNTIEAFAAALPRTAHISLPDAVRAFRIWNLFLGDFDDGNHYPFGSEVGVAAPSFLRSYPAVFRSPDGPSYLGGEEIRLMANQAAGGWVLDFEGEPLVRWDVSIVTLPARLDARPRLAEVRLDPEGRGMTAIPWEDLAGVIVLVQNLGSERREPAGYVLSARHDPLVPFDLMSFTAEEEDGAAAVRWSTEREMNLAGWLIHRSRHPDTGFTPINTLMIPATGGAAPASYQFMDGDVRPGRKYYYILEAATRDGFKVLTHAAAVRLSPEPERTEAP